MPLLSHLLIVLILAMGAPDPSWADQVQDGHNQDGQVQGYPGCLIRDIRYTARLAETSLTGAPEEHLRITVRLDPETLPIGYFVSTNVRVITAPAPPDILPGFPKITVTCPEPGEYVLEVSTSLLTRTSCVGVSACSLSEQRVTLRIH
ncbi:hypothetical protein [Desulfonatronum thioautotrophicum]|uniref:hypothetical protein n=1 Tax=Desulfonatronum thioautotrophicum TaxID=617001 RepID=UPI0005EB168E|nr:hypothetical protein [Desulfonatronum thioautotrophicum]